MNEAKQFKIVQLLHFRRWNLYFLLYIPEGQCTHPYHTGTVRAVQNEYRTIKLNYFLHLSCTLTYNICSLKQHEYTVLNHIEYLYLLLMTVYLQKINTKSVTVPLYFITYVHMYRTIHMFSTRMRHENRTCHCASTILSILKDALCLFFSKFKPLNKHSIRFHLFSHFQELNDFLSIYSTTLEEHFLV